MHNPADSAPLTVNLPQAEAQTPAMPALGQDESGLPPNYLRHAVLDAAARMRTGLVAYPALWIVLMPVNGFAERHPWLAWLNALVLVLVSVGRYLFNERTLPGLLERDLHRGRNTFRLLSILYNLYWGVLSAAVMISPDAGELRWLVIMSTVGITASGTVNIALDSVLPRFHSVCTLGPSVLALLPLGGTVHYAVVGLFIVLMVYARNISRLVAREYWGRLHNQYLLEEHARELQQLSRTDTLTQVANRLRFQEALADAWRDARRRNEPMSVAIVDLDFFKRINDTHGHLFGDQCLRAAAQALVEGVRRPYDLVARFGGEEFAVLLPNTTLDNAALMAERLLRQVLAVSLENGSQLVDLSCSIGVASCLPAGHGGDAGSANDPEALLRQADEALYAAKQAGRARVCLYQAKAQGHSAPMQAMTTTTENAA
jgi:diguanylate cyclase (GGDEF)-like protein